MPISLSGIRDDEVTKRTVIWMLVLLLLFYVGSYIVLSVSGRYEPSVWGIAKVNGSIVSAPKWYDWAPRGFVSNLKWRQGMMLFFLPLWELDRFAWHDSDKCWSGKYPVNETKPRLSGSSSGG